MNSGSLQCLSTCPSGGNSSTCHYCHTQCNGCNGPSNTDCVSCIESQITNSQGQTVCVPVCNANEYRLEVSGDYLCIPCHSQCNGCTGGSNIECKQCKNVNNTFSSSNECVAACPFGSYANEQNKCLRCDPQCFGCTGPSSYNCSRCTDSSLTQATGEIVCVPTCPIWQTYDLSIGSCGLTM